jgi:NTP pyrophosphatase (non-canonical NTP hydrolase)
MKMNDYQIAANSTAIYPENVGLAYVALGLGEAGEIQNIVKKIYRDKGGILDEESRQKLKKEYGDLLWYVAQGCKEIGFTMEEVAQTNLDKLFQRKLNGTLQGSGDDR